MTYKYNPKTKDSGIICAIPQSEPCPLKCEGCFFLGGRSYLEPLDENLPNMPTKEQIGHKVVRVNDGGDSSLGMADVMMDTERFPLKFYNTSIPDFIAGFQEPVVLTINPGSMTDINFYRLDPIPPNLMFVRFRTNMWNIFLGSKAVEYYSEREVPVVLTFMAYESVERIPMIYRKYYIHRKRTLNTYWAIDDETWDRVMSLHIDNKWVYSCGTGGENGTSLCRFCGNCLREFYATKERMSNDTINTSEKTATLDKR